MFRLLGFSLVLAGFLALSTDLALGQNKGNQPNKKGDASPATPQQYVLLTKYKEMTGTIQSANPAGGSLVLRVEYDHPDANRPNANLGQNNAQLQQIQQQLQKIQREEAALRTAANPAQMQQKLAQLNRDKQALQTQLQNLQKGSPSHLKKDLLDFELPFAEKTVVRKMNAGVEYDEKGNVKEPEPAAKGDANLPGVAANIEDVMPGMKARVYLLPPKAASALAKMEKKKDEDGGPANALLPANRPQVRMVVLLGEPAGMQNKKRNK